MTSLAVAALVVIVGIVAMAHAMKRWSMFFPDRYPAGYWNSSNWPVRPEDHVFNASDGIRLHGWLFRAGREHAPLLIWFHGNAGNLTMRAPSAIELSRRGCNVFLLDYRGFGRSEGSPSERTLFLDVLAAYDYAAKLTGTPPGRIALYGESIGGPYAAWTALRRGAACVVLENSFGSLTTLVNALYRPLPLGLLFPRSLTTVRWLNEARVPVLVAHGRKDTIIPFALAERMYAELRVPKEMYSSERAGHGEIAAFDGARYHDAVIRFVEASSSEP